MYVRYTNSMMNTNMMSSMQRNYYDLNVASTQIATGKRMLRPSDDFIASRRLLELDQTKSELDAYSNNIATLTARFDAMDTALQGMMDPMYRLTELLVGAGDVALDQGGRDAIATEIEELMGSLEHMLNAQSPDGSYLFSGNQSDQPPLVNNNGNWTFNGDTEDRFVPIGDGVTTNANIDAVSALFGPNGENMFDTMEDVVTVLRDPNITMTDQIYINTMQAGRDAIDNATSSLTLSQAELGGRMNAVDLMGSTHTDTILFNELLQGKLEDVDLPTAIMEVATTQTALIAIQKTYRDVANMSLFDLM